MLMNLSGVFCGRRRRGSPATPAAYGRGSEGYGVRPGPLFKEILQARRGGALEGRLTRREDAVDLLRREYQTREVSFGKCKLLFINLLGRICAAYRVCL